MRIAVNSCISYPYCDFSLFRRQYHSFPFHRRGLLRWEGCYELQVTRPQVSWITGMIYAFVFCWFVYILIRSPTGCGVGLGPGKGDAH